MYSTEEAIKRTLKDIEAMEEANKILPAVKKVIEKYNGKVINKRLNDSLKDIAPRLYLSTQYDNLYEIHYCPASSNQWFCILSGQRPTSKYYSQEKSFVDPDKRISAARAFQNIEEHRIERLKKITAYKEHLQTWQEKKAQIDMLKKQLKTLTDSIPYTMQDYFNMRVKYY